MFCPTCGSIVFQKSGILYCPSCGELGKSEKKEVIFHKTRECPKCGSKRINQEDVESAFDPWYQYPSHYYYFHCRDCGNRWHI